MLSDEIGGHSMNIIIPAYIRGESEIRRQAKWYAIKRNRKTSKWSAITWNRKSGEVISDHLKSDSNRKKCQTTEMNQEMLWKEMLFDDCYPGVHNLKSKDIDSNRYGNLNLESKEVKQRVSEIQRHWKASCAFSKDILGLLSRKKKILRIWY